MGVPQTARLQSRMGAISAEARLGNDKGGSGVDSAVV